MTSIAIFDLDEQEIDSVNGAGGPVGAAAGAIIGFGYSVYNGLSPGQTAWNTALGAASGFVGGIGFSAAAAQTAAKVGSGGVAIAFREQ